MRRTVKKRKIRSRRTYDRYGGHIVKISNFNVFRGSINIM